MEKTRLTLIMLYFILAGKYEVKHYRELDHTSDIEFNSLIKSEKNVEEIAQVITQINWKESCINNSYYIKILFAVSFISFILLFLLYFSYEKYYIFLLPPFIFSYHLLSYIWSLRPDDEKYQSFLKGFIAAVRAGDSKLANQLSINYGRELAQQTKNEQS